jgi:hypothetical protein
VTIAGSGITQSLAFCNNKIYSRIDFPAGTHDDRIQSNSQKDTWWSDVQTDFVNCVEVDQLDMGWTIATQVAYWEKTQPNYNDMLFAVIPGSQVEYAEFRHSSKHEPIIEGGPLVLFSDGSLVSFNMVDENLNKLKVSVAKCGALYEKKEVIEPGG